MSSPSICGGAGMPSRARCSAASTTRCGARPRTIPCACWRSSRRPGSKPRRRTRSFLRLYDRAIAALDDARMARNTWWMARFPQHANQVIAYFSAEFALASIAADLRRRPWRAGRRSLQGGGRPRRPADRRRVHVSAGLLSPAHFGRRLAGGELRAPQLDGCADRAGDDPRRPARASRRCRSAIDRCWRRSGACAWGG